jgi:serine/threonine-protein kinase RsbW
MASSSRHFVIPSDFAKMREVQQIIMTDVEGQPFDDEGIFAIKLALEETIINAIKHGNKFDPTKTVTIDSKTSADQFEITICDQGEGFKRKQVPDPLAEENLEKSSGRGLLLIESYMDSVKYSNGGRCVKMMRKNRKL